jgi:hypothetical protein
MVNIEKYGNFKPIGKQKRKKRIFTTTKTKLDTEIFENDLKEKEEQPKIKKRIRIL